MSRELPTTWRAAGALLTACGLAACAGAAPDAGPSSGVQITVAPLSLPSVTNADYRLQVHSGAGAQVVDVAVSADQYGDGAGSLSYLAPCDASDGDNVVTIELLELYGGSAGTAALDRASYQNPGPLSRTAPCRENEDTFVSFDITILRAANQGFFDVAVSFDDIFCSAKLDCVDALLTDGAGDRNTTLVLGFACTAGANEQDTWLYLDDVVVACDGGNVTLSPTSGPGRVDEALVVEGASPLFGAMIFQGEEALGFKKRFWNIALGFTAGDDCRLSTAGTAAGTELEGKTTPAATTWPVIIWDVDISDGDGTLICSEHPIHGDNGVATAYTPIEAPRTFAHVYGPPSSELLAFTTLKGYQPGQTFNGNIPAGSGRFDSLEDADRVCAAHAASVDLGGVWRAYLSDSARGIRASDRLPDGVSWWRTDGALIANNREELRLNTLTNPVQLTETGYLAPSSSRAWTGTAADGEPSSFDCAGWSVGHGDNGQIGTVGSTGTPWVATSAFNCLSGNRLYCFQIAP